MALVLAETQRAAVLQDEVTHCEEPCSGLLTHVFTRELSRASRPLTHSGLPSLASFIPAPTITITTTHSLTLHPRLLLRTFDDSPDEI